SGSQLMKTSDSLALISLPMARMLASRLACVSTTPFGDPVLPEVYCSMAIESPEGGLGCGSNGSACVSSAADQTCRRVGTLERSRCATDRASGIVMSAAAALTRTLA